MSIKETMKLDIDTERFIKELGKKGNRLQIAAAESLNESAEEIKNTYKKKLQKNSKLRNKFSLGAIRIFKANPIRKSGEPRQLSRINAIIGILKLRGGKHYLAKLEEGSTNRGNPKTKGKVPIPLQGSRISQSDDKAISAPNRLTNGDTQTLKVGGKNIGVKGDGYSGNNRRRWGVLYGAVRSKKISGNVRKPFYMIDSDGVQGIFKMIRNVISKIRDLSKTRTKVKAEPNFKRSVNSVRPDDIQKTFIKNAKRELGR